MQQLRSYSWPGNVRELQHVIERAVITATRGRLTFDLPDATPRVAEPKAAPAPRVLTDAQVRRVEADNLGAALRAAQGRVYGPDGAAALLGLKPTTLASRMKALGIARPRG